MKKVSKIITATILVAVFITALLLIIDHGRGDIFPTFWLESAETVTTAPTFEPTTPPTPSPVPSPESTLEPTPEPTPEPQPEYFVLSFVGDCTFACDDSQNSSPYNFNAIVGDSFAFPFEYVENYFSADELTLVNLECAITDYPYAREKTFTFAANPKYLALFEYGSIEFANLANNHSYDYNEQGYIDTKEYLDSINAAYSCHDDISIFTTKSGLTVGVYATDYDTYPADPTEAISALKALSPNLIIYAPHWGIEGAYTLADNQIINAHKAIDAGADIVFGTHPHVLQRIEEYNGKYIFYSLGNFIFGGNTAPRDRDTAILQVTVERAPDGTVRLLNYEAIPCALSSESAYNNYQPIPYVEGSVEYDRAMSKLLGTFTGPNLVVDYSFMHKDDPSPTPETPADTESSAESEEPAQPATSPEAETEVPEASSDTPAESPESDVSTSPADDSAE